MSEDDLLFADELPDFGGALSKEESESLLSFLTVPYVRIPLVIGFFASRDRATYLMNEQLQALFTAVLFEGGTWVDKRRRHCAAIDEVPLRRYDRSASIFGNGGGYGTTGARGESETC